MATYDSAAALAKRLIEKKGGKVTLRRFGAQEVVDADKPWEGSAPDPASVPKTVKAVFLNFSFKGAEPLRFADDTLVRAGDKKVLLAATSLGSSTPGLNDQIVRADGTVWTIKNLKTLDPDGQKILYEAWVTL